METTWTNTGVRDYGRHRWFAAMLIESCQPDNGDKRVDWLYVPWVVAMAQRKFQGKNK